MRYMKKIYFILATCIVFFLSCKKESAVKDPALDPGSNSDPSLLFLNNATSDAYDEKGFYIKGNFNGHDLCFATTDYEYNDPFFPDTFMNAYFVYHDHDSVTNDNLN